MFGGGASALPNSPGSARAGYLAAARPWIQGQAAASVLYARFVRQAAAGVTNADDLEFLELWNNGAATYLLDGVRFLVATR